MEEENSEAILHGEQQSFPVFPGKDPILAPIRGGGIAPEALMEQCRDPLPLSEVYSHAPTEPFPCSILEPTPVPTAEEDNERYSEPYQAYHAALNAIHGQSPMIDLYNSDPSAHQTHTFSFFSL